MAFGRMCVLPIVSEFLKNYPEINVRLLLSDRNLNLLDDHVDLAVRVGELPDSRMVAIRLGSIRRVVCGSPNYFAIHGEPRTPADLAEYTCVTFTGLAAGAPWAFKSRNGLSQAVPPRCRLNINTAEAAVDAAVAGVGITHVLSYHVAQAVAEGKLQIVLSAFEPGPLSVSLVHAGQDLLPLKMRRFLEFSGPRLKKALAMQLPEG